jgi:hypothetical protein
MYLSHQMLSNLTPRQMTAGEQREADEQRGQIAAAAARWGRRVAARVHAAAARPDRPDRPARHPHPQAAFRKAGPAPHRSPYRA